ncbi:mannose-1-phosphate guanylyltransferase [Paenibacillus beijingensis]|uniref:Mannose-1-phosphate guanylyltransferase n=1 Tax=Paenibacillus beijingensis TaxID=1126833 RepID=A0A0D5NIC1_9BACL|nr:sugar phosphate nucleotidyltransferase [Paenibacillus beijingensis]AJY74870.1 hypothetical protein VN24_10060 [Paenibacillus beijingensis]
MDKYAVIMAGGAGQRLWPFSRERKPKQFISVDGKKSMLEQTVTRIQDLIPPERCYVITNKNYLELTREVLKDVIPESNIILEPLQRNTAACISYASLLLEKKFKTGSVCFIPADSYIHNKYEYLKAVHQAYRETECCGGLVVIGVNPTYPATGYGYIQVNPTDRFGSRNVCNVHQFKEKPNLDTAKKYVKTGTYLWNSGMVAGSFQAFRDEIKLHMPHHFALLSKALEHHDSPDFQNEIANAYAGLPRLSFDNGVLEHCNGLRTVKGYFDWNDIGSLDSLAQTVELDANNNAVVGHHIGIDTSDSIIYSQDMLVTTIGLTNVIIVKTEDAMIVCPKERAQDIKTLVEMLKKSGHEKYT